LFETATSYLHHMPNERISVMSSFRDEFVRSMLVFALLLVAHRGALAQVSVYPITGEAYALERDALDNVVSDERRALPALSIGSAEVVEVKLGPVPNTNAFGMPTYARAYVDNAGTFWGEVEADNPSAPNARGRGVAQATLEYTMLRDAPQTDFAATISGGKLELRDGGGSNVPSSARVTFVANVYDVGKTNYLGSQLGYAVLSGNGGSTTSETLDYESTGLAVTPAHYSETTSGGFVGGASLLIPASNFKLDSLESYTVPGTRTMTLTELLDSGAIGLGASFIVELRLTAEADNQFGEKAATAYLRDPTFFGSADFTSGGVGVSFSGLSVTTPIPEPHSIVLLGIGLLALGVRRARAHSGLPHRAYQ
jgi:hypothetical protein